MTPDEIAAARWENHQRKLEIEADMRDRSLNYDYSADHDEPQATAPPQPAMTRQQQAAQDWDARLQRTAEMIITVCGEKTGAVHREMDSTTLALQAQIDQLNDRVAALADEINYLRDEQRSSKSWWRR